MVSVGNQPGKHNSAVRASAVPLNKTFSLKEINGVRPEPLERLKALLKRADVSDEESGRAIGMALKELGARDSATGSDFVMTLAAIARNESLKQDLRDEALKLCLIRFNREKGIFITAGKIPVREAVETLLYFQAEQSALPATLELHARKGERSLRILFGKATMLAPELYHFFVEHLVETDTNGRVKRLKETGQVEFLHQLGDFHRAFAQLCELYKAFGKDRNPHAKERIKYRAQSLKREYVEKDALKLYPIREDYLAKLWQDKKYGGSREKVEARFHEITRVSRWR